MKTVWLEDMSWPDVEEALSAGVDTVIVCAASNEQHGPHLAENTDYEIGRAVYQSAAKSSAARWWRPSSAPASPPTTCASPAA